jgi:D-alanyl-D-alanine carboxypeptidase
MRDIICNYQVKMYYADGRHRTLTTTNYLLNPKSSFYRAEARGMKTGTTNAAGACLLSAFWVDGRYILIGVFQGPTFNSRYQSATKLFDYFKAELTAPTTEPSVPPTEEPTQAPTTEPTVEPTLEPTIEPTVEPTTEPTCEPTEGPSSEPTIEPTMPPSEEPSVEPEPTVEPIPT